MGVLGTILGYTLGGPLGAVAGAYSDYEAHKAEKKQKEQIAKERQRKLDEAKYKRGLLRIRQAKAGTLNSSLEDDFEKKYRDNVGDILDYYENLWRNADYTKQNDLNMAGIYLSSLSNAKTPQERRGVNKYVYKLKRLF